MSRQLIARAIERVAYDMPYMSEETESHLSSPISADEVKEFVHNVLFAIVDDLNDSEN